MCWDIENKTAPRNDNAFISEKKHVTHERKEKIKICEMLFHFPIMMMPDDDHLKRVICVWG